MKPSYKDILDLAREAPFWYDQNGTPRYCKFHPRHASNIYAREVVLLKIECASCRERFLVEMNTTGWGIRLDSFSYGMSLVLRRDDIGEVANLNYGDPPHHTYQGHQCAGTTMTCDDIRIMQFWRKDADGEWERVKEYEIYLVD